MGLWLLPSVTISKKLLLVAFRTTTNDAMYMLVYIWVSREGVGREYEWKGVELDLMLDTEPA